MDFKVNRLYKDCQEIVYKNVHQDHYDEIFDQYEAILTQKGAINMAVKMLEAAEMLLWNAKIERESEICGNLSGHLKVNYEVQI